MSYPDGSLHHGRDRTRNVVYGEAKVLPVVRGSDVVACAVLGLLLPVVVMAAWMFGVYALGAGASVVMCGVPLCAVSSAAGLWWFLHGHKGWGFRELGFVKARRSLWHLVWEAPLVMLGAAVIAATIGAVVGISPSTSGGTADGAGLAPAVTALTIACGVCITPVVEEVIFRRMLFGWLGQRLPVVVAVIVTGVIFGACHLAPALMLYVIPWGIGVTALRAWHDSLWASLIAHIANNTMASVVVWFALT